MTREEARRYMIQWQQELKDGGFSIDSDRIQALRVAIEALSDGPHGEWIVEYSGNGWNDWTNVTCSVCGEKFEKFGEHNFCPNCRAKMIGGDTE